MKHSKTTDYVTCDRCGDDKPLEGLDARWIEISASFVTMSFAPDTTHHLCPECAAAGGKFLSGEFAPPIPEMIEQPYETLTGDDFVYGGNGHAPWECDLMHGGHKWAWSSIDRVWTRFCDRCYLKGTASRRIEGTK
jgi:hypothetical protein